MPDAAAIWFAAPRTVEVRHEPVPEPGRGQVRIAALASGISAGSELLVYRGEAPPELLPDLPTISGGFGLPMKFGYASVGRVVEQGPAVESPEVGDLVFAHHPHQTEYVVAADLPVVLPSGLLPELGVFTANLETAVTVALDAHPRLAETVLVVGQGVVGLLVTMLLRRTGATVIAVDSLERRRSVSRALGADHVLEPGDGLAASVYDLTGGRRVDVAIEASGNPVALQACIDAVAFGGTVVVASWYGTRSVALDLGRAFHRRRIRVVASQVSTIDPAIAARWTRERRASLVGDLLGELPLSTLISHRFRLAEAERAYEMLDRDPVDAVQVIFCYDTDEPGAVRPGADARAGRVLTGR